MAIPWTRGPCAVVRPTYHNAQRAAHIELIWQDRSVEAAAYSIGRTQWAGL
jgi:hypothetical protein